jgi:hypothetical protein
MEIRPVRRWVVASVALVAISWLVLLALAFFGWTDADWIGKAILAWLFLVGGAVSGFLLRGWKNLYLIADETTIRFGKRSLLRSHVSEISTGPVAGTATQFWLGVVVMTLSQDFARRVYFRAADGGVLLETTDLYGSRQLARLAAYLRIPFVDRYRRPPPLSTP